MERWNHFLRWFFNSSPTALLEPIRDSTEPCRELRGSDLAKRGTART